MAGTILYFDDQPDLPEEARQALRREGFEVVLTDDPEEAIRVVDTDDPALVLMELLVPGIDSLHLLEGIRDRSPNVSIVILSRAERDAGLLGEAIALGAKDTLTKPVLASELVASVLEFAAEPPPPLDLVDELVEEPEEEAALGGDLSDTPLPEVLRRVHQRGATGVLIASHDNARLGVQLRNGSPVAIGSSRAPESLPDFLLRTGRIDRRRHADVLDMESYGEESAYEILLAMRLLSEAEIQLALREQAEEPLFEAFPWDTGSYRFAEGMRITSNALRLERDYAELVLEGVLRAVASQLARDRLHKRATLYVSGRDSDEGLPAGFELGAEQRRLLGELNGEGTLGELMETGAFSDCLLYGLWVAGWIELHPTPMLTLLDALYQEGADDEDEPEETTGEIAIATGEVTPTTRSLRDLARQVLVGDDFAALDVPVTATDAEIREAYEKLLHEIPPDALGSPDAGVARRARRILERIEEAFSHLRNPDMRRAYALLRSQEEQDRGVDAERALEAERSFRQGEGALARKRYDDAIAAFGMAAHLDPAQGEYLSHLGYALYVSNPEEEVVRREAMENIANGIKRSPERETSYVLLGRVLRAQGDIETARKVLRRALQLKPDCYPAQQEMRLLDSRARRAKGFFSRLLRR